MANAILDKKLLVASKPEKAIYNALKRLGITFEFQSSLLGGRQWLGGVVADFYLPENNLIISCLGLYWHYTQPDRITKDKIQGIALETRGIKVIFIDEDDALRNALFYVSEALRGIDHSRLGGRL